MLHPQSHRHTQGRAHTRTHAATKLSKLQVSLLLTVIRDTRCVSTHHVLLTRGCDQGTRHLPHPFPLPPEHLARLHFPVPFAVDVLVSLSCTDRMGVDVICATPRPGPY